MPALSIQSTIILRRKISRLVWVAAALLTSACHSQGRLHAIERGESYTGLADSTVLIIRHAEKPEEGSGLALEGERRAKAYVRYFSNLKLEGHPMLPDCLVASADGPESRRPRLTLKPLAKALALTIDYRHAARDVAALTDELKKAPHGKCILICWHHGEIDRLVELLGADPGTLLPRGRWPDELYDWLLVLSYDHDGRLRDARRLCEALMPGDSAN